MTIAQIPLKNYKDICFQNHTKVIVTANGTEEGMDFTDKYVFKPISENRVNLKLFDITDDCLADREYSNSDAIKVIKHVIDDISKYYEDGEVTIDAYNSDKLKTRSTRAPRKTYEKSNGLASLEKAYKRML